jgi:DUF4097 and DUF4098 domain-containing protein YvlB
MMRNVAVWLLASSLFITVAAMAAAGDEHRWDLSGVKDIDIKGISGHVVIVAADGRAGVIELRSRVRPQDSFGHAVDRRKSGIRIKEKWYGSSRGDVLWTISLPGTGKAPAVRISNASGNLECHDVAVGISYKTASGDVELSNVTLGEDSKFNTASGNYTIRRMTISEDSHFNTASGDYDLEDLIIEEGSEFTTASGDITITDCTSSDDVSFSSASGNVEVRSIELTGESGFSSASGDVEVRFDRLPKKDFTASSASGDVTLEVEDFGHDFTLVMIKRKHKGRISCPFDITDEEEFEKNGQVYVSKIVKRGLGKPVITLETASGRVVVRD